MARPSTTPARRRRVLRAAVAAASLGLLCTVSAGPGRADVPTSAFTATANARLVGVDMILHPTIGFDPLIDAGEAVASAQLSSRGTSRAFASQAYPGATALAMPGTISILTKGEVPADSVPAYPLYVGSEHPITPNQHLGGGPYVLDASSDPNASSASAGDGLTTGSASVRRAADSGVVTATAEAVVGSVDLGVVKLNGVRSSALVRTKAAGGLERSSSFDVTSATVLGRTVALGRGGLQVLTSTAGADVPATLRTALAPVLSQLAQQGTTLELLPAAETDDGTTSGGLRITSAQAAPPGVASGVDTVTVVTTLGASSASVANLALGDDEPELVLPPGEAPPSTPFESVAIPPTDTSRSADALPAAAPTELAVAAPASPAPRAAAAVKRIAAGLPDGPQLSGFYPVLVLAGLALFGMARLFSFFGRRPS